MISLHLEKPVWDYNNNISCMRARLLASNNTSGLKRCTNFAISGLSPSTKQAPNTFLTFSIEWSGCQKIHSILPHPPHWRSHIWLSFKFWKEGRIMARDRLALMPLIDDCNCDRKGREEERRGRRRDLERESSKERREKNREARGSRWHLVFSFMGKSYYHTI